MKNFMEPESVALIGISRKSGPGSFNLMENMIRFGFSGKIYPVNPNSTEILGRRAYPNITAINEKIDLAVITTPRETTLRILEDCVAAGVKAAIVINQGFADADSLGKELQQGMSEIARRDGMRILGPNTLGVINNYNGFTTSFMPITKEQVPIGLICQSGIFFVGAREFSRSIGKGIDIGNACDIGFCETLQYLGEDPEIRVIAIHMEGLNQGKEFLELAEKIVKEKPVIIHKTGSSERGAEAAISHSGSMAGNYQVYKAALTQAGVTFLEEDGQMVYAVKTLLNLPPMKGDRVAVITFSGAAGIMISDSLERHGLKLASLSPETIESVAQLSPDWMPLGNPLDIWPAVMLNGTEKVYSMALDAVLRDDNVDGVVCVAIGPEGDFSFLDVSEALKEVTEKLPDKPVAAWLYGPNTVEIGEKFESTKRIMVYPTLDVASWSLSLLRDRYEVLGGKL
ncbi:MAG: CoA-binding protein [Desulfobacteraceae bacterium]|nr:CoA-binding protein [Desulfobacteraceae bacterium]